MPRAEPIGRVGALLFPSL